MRTARIIAEPRGFRARRRRGRRYSSRSRNRRGGRPTTSGMNPDAVACALWIGSLLVAVDPTVHPLPSDELVTTYLALVRPATRA